MKYIKPRADQLVNRALRWLVFVAGWAAVVTLYAVSWRWAFVEPTL